MDPFVKTTLFNYMGITEKEYNQKYLEAEASGKCLICGVDRHNNSDLLCDKHRFSYNVWSEQFFTSKGNSNIEGKQ